MKDLLGNWFWLAILTALIWGFTAPLEKAGLRKIDPVAGIVARCIGAVIGMMVITVLRPSVWSDMKGAGFWPVMALVTAGILGTVVGQFTNLHALKIGDVSKVSPIAGAWPLIAFLLAVVLAGEELTARKIAGALTIVGGVFLIRA